MPRLIWVFAGRTVIWLVLSWGGSCYDDFSRLGAWCSVFGRAHLGATVGFLLLKRFSVGLTVEYSSGFISVLNLDLYVCCSMHWWVKRNPSGGPNNLYVYEPQHNLGWGLRARKTGLSAVYLFPPPPQVLYRVWLTVLRRCFCCGLFYLPLFIRFMFVFDI